MPLINTAGEQRAGRTVAPPGVSHTPSDSEKKHLIPGANRGAGQHQHEDSVRKAILALSPARVRLAGWISGQGQLHPKLKTSPLSLGCSISTSLCLV